MGIIRITEMAEIRPFGILIMIVAVVFDRAGSAGSIQY